MNLDVWLFHGINDFVGTIPALDWAARALVNDYVVPTTMSLTAVALWLAGATEEERRRNQRAVLMIALALLLANALIKDLAIIYFRPRPFATEEVKLLFYRPSVSSFPSVPTTMAFCFAAGVFVANRKIGKFMCVLGSLYGLARVYAGVHYPLDVIGGAAIGIGAVYMIQRLAFIIDPWANRFIHLAQRFYLA